MRTNVFVLILIVILAMAMAKNHTAHQELCNELISRWLSTLKPTVELENATLTTGKQSIFII